MSISAPTRPARTAAAVLGRIGTCARRGRRPERRAAGAPRVPDLESEAGRGLSLVESLCDSWGWYPTTGPDDTTRKIVWARLASPRR
jgi:hypothetical protein